MTQQNKSEAIKALDVMVDELKEEGNSIFYCLARYDDGADFLTYIHRATDVHADTVLSYAMIRYSNSQTGKASHVENVYINRETLELLQAVRNEGWNILFIHGKSNSPNSDEGETTWGIYETLAHYKEHAPHHHVRLDMYREILVEWSNASHTSQLVWKEGG